MANFFSYLRKYGNKSIQEEPWNILDALVFTGIVYLPLPTAPSNELKDGDRLQFLIQRFINHPVAYNLCVMPLTDMKFARTIVTKSRFKDIKMYGYYETISESEYKQFRACTFVSDDEKDIFISFCGTDTTLVGWKENFDMAVKKETPSQKTSINYLTNIANRFPNANIYIGGHSKGGNLAMYASIYVSKEIQDRIKYVFNFDGPGLGDLILKEPEYQNIRKKIISVFPYYSFIGVLFNQSDDYRIIASNGVGFYNHAFYFWKIKDKDFVYRHHISRMSAKMHLFINKAIASFNDNERKAFLDNIYTIFTAGGAKTTHAIIRDIRMTLTCATGVFENMDDETKEKMLAMFWDLIALRFKKMSDEEKQVRKKIEQLANKK